MTNEDLIKESSFITCTCEKIYTNRKLVAPDCIACNYRDEVIGLMDAARKDEALKVFEFILKDGQAFWFTTTPEQLYKLFKNDNKKKTQ